MERLQHRLNYHMVHQTLSFTIKYLVLLSTHSQNLALVKLLKSQCTCRLPTYVALTSRSGLDVRVPVLHLFPDRLLLNY